MDVFVYHFWVAPYEYWCLWFKGEAGGGDGIVNPLTLALETKLCGHANDEASF